MDTTLRFSELTPSFGNRIAVASFVKLDDATLLFPGNIDNELFA